jgi:hypothetical protein
MVLTGKTPDGKPLEVRLLHLQNHEGAPAGATVKPGDLLGFVGNTGGTSTGPHMHIDISVDGKRVDPEKYLKRAAKKQEPPKEPKAPEETEETGGGEALLDGLPPFEDDFSLPAIRLNDPQRNRKRDEMERGAR